MNGCAIDKQINYHNKQSARHYEKAIKKGYKPKADTVYILDTLLIKETRIDTTFIEKEGDTILIEKERLKVKYVRFADSVFIEAECEAETIIKKIPFTVQEKIYIKTTIYDNIGLDTRWKIITFWIVLVIALILFIWVKVKP